MKTAKYIESDDIVLVSYKGYTVKLIIDVGNAEFGNFIADAINEKVERLSTPPDEGEKECDHVWKDMGYACSGYLKCTKCNKTHKGITTP